jgi:hypothetical protein
MLAKAGSDRIAVHVLESRVVVLLALDHPRGEPVAPEMAGPTMAAIEALGVDPVESLHPRREIRLRRIDDEVVVRSEQACEVHLPVEAHGAFGQERQKRHAILPVAEDVRTGNSARGDVVDPVGQERAKRTCHRGQGTDPSAPFRPRCAFRLAFVAKS